MEMVTFVEQPQATTQPKRPQATTSKHRTKAPTGNQSATNDLWAGHGAEPRDDVEEDHDDDDDDDDDVMALFFVCQASSNTSFLDFSDCIRSASLWLL